MKKSRRPVFVGSLAALAVLAAACGGSSGGSAGGGSSSCTWVIGTIGALSGDYASIGVPIEEGVKYAIDQANKSGDLACQLSEDKEDSQGSDVQATPLARQMAQNAELVAVIGPYFSGETLASGPIFDQAGVPFITASATDPSLADQGWTTFFRTVANDADQGPTAAFYIDQALKPSSVVVIDDNSQYGKTLAGVVASKLGGIVTGPYHIDPAETDYSAVVAQVKNANPDVVYYGGYTPQAAPLALQLKDAGVNAQFFSDDGSKDPTFGDLAKGAAAGVLATCPCADPLKIPAAKSFVSGMKSEFNKPPGTYAADAFDAVNLVVEALKKQDSGASVPDIRTAIVDYFGSVQNFQGLTKSYTFDDTGQVEIDPLKNIWIYQWDDKAGTFLSLGPAGEAAKK